MAYKKEQRWEMRYEVPTADGWIEKVVFSRSEEVKDRNFQHIKKNGYKLVSCKKLYPFSMMKNQHNFQLISDICHNRIYDAIDDKNVNQEEFNALHELMDNANKYFCYPLPVAWVTWEDLKEMKEISAMAVNHRMETCIENGRYDLLKYC